MTIDNCIKNIGERVVATENQNLGLMGGLAGNCVFYANIYLFYKEERQYVMLENSLKELIELLSSNNLSSTFSNGISGIIWMLKYLNKIGLLESIDELGLSRFNSLLNTRIEKELLDKNWDFLHGALGMSLCLGKDNNYSINRIVNYFYEKQVPAENKSFSLDSQLHPGKINLGLSHGITSILYFLLLGLNQKGLKRKSLLLIKSIINTLLNHEHNYDHEGYAFDCFVGDNHKSRLAWCYGDLSIAFILYKAGIVLEDESLRAKAIEIAINTTHRKTIEDTHVYDACLCHGSSGLFVLYNKFYKIIGDDRFKTTANYWLLRTLEILENNNYQFYSAIHNKWENNISLLEGLPGVGLALISAVSDIEPTWDESLLLS